MACEYTPPARNAVDFILELYTPPARNAVDFELCLNPVGSVGGFNPYYSRHLAGSGGNV